jgi:hypothetical protein
MVINILPPFPRYTFCYHLTDSLLHATLSYEMADLPATLSFKAPVWMVEWLRRLAKDQRRTVGNVIRVLLETAHTRGDD